MDDHHTKAHTSRLLSCVLPVSAEAPAMAREAIGELADVLAPDLIQDTQLLVSELVLNRVRFRTGHGGTLELEVSVTEPSVRVQVVDDDHRRDPQPIRTRKPELGWKLEIVAEIADRWGIGGDRLTTVWFELDR